MKAIIKVIGILFLMLFSVTVFAQVESPDFPEKLTLLFNDQLKMVIESREILNIPQDKKQDTIFSNLLMDINKVQDSLSKMSSPLMISYYAIDKNNRKLKITALSDTKAEFIFTGNSDTVSSSFFNYKIEYSLDKNNKFVLYTNRLLGLSSLNNVSFTELIQQAKSHISGRKIAAYKAKTCVYKIKNNKIDTLSADIKKQSMLAISPGIDFGLSYVNDRFLYTTSISMAYVISRKTAKIGMIGISGESYVNMAPDKPYDTQLNEFVDVFYHIKNPYHPLYYARDTKVFAGYLAGRDGNVFQKNTWRFGFDMPAGNNFRIKYVVYNLISSYDTYPSFEVGMKYKFF